MAAPKDLYTAALWGGSVRRYGDMVQLTMPGIGVVTTQQDMQQATSWARSKMASGAINKDRMQLMDRLETLIARQYSGCSTRGGNRTIAGLAKIMASTGMDLESWSIPKAVMDELFPPRVIADPFKPKLQAAEPEPS